MRTRRLLLTVAAFGVLLAGCGTAQPADQASLSSSPTPTASAPATASPAAGVTLRYAGNAQVELSANGGARVLIDVYDPDALSAPPTADDVLLTTHRHDDHVSAGFPDGFPGEQLFVREGALETPDATITGVAAAHSQGDRLAAKGGTDYIFIVDMGGMRIAHFGDLGQTALTRGQLKALGDVDIAVTQFDNSFSQMDTTNLKGFKLMQQVKPRLIVQTHSSLAAVEHAGTLWPLLYSERPWVTFTAAGLPATTSLLLLGDDAAFYAEQVPAEKVDW